MKRFWILAIFLVFILSLRKTYHAVEVGSIRQKVLLLFIINQFKNVTIEEN